MQAFFSILLASSRPEIQEQVSIGLLLVGSNSVYFETSKTKLAIANQLLKREAFRYLNDTLKQVSRLQLMKM